VALQVWHAPELHRAEQVSCNKNVSSATAASTIVPEEFPEALPLILHIINRRVGCGL
jgi:hypothetical protein